MNKDLYIVAIGASAGGLEALYEFFDNMPENTDMAFVVIQHLSPNFKSMMNELLAKHTKMSVEVIQGDTEPQANHIYLIPSGDNITIKNGIIRQVKRPLARGVNLPVDVFFHALGKDQKEKAIGIILSGSGTDGSRGIQTIKEMGGMVFVQDPATAQFDGMPKAALSIGIVDSILPPFSMARNLVRIVGDSSSISIPPIDPENGQNEEMLYKILNRVAEVTGVDFKEYRTGTLVRRTQKRMLINHISSLENYYIRLLEEEQETRTLFKEFLISVTRFFRDKDAFGHLKEKVSLEILKEKAVNEEIRVWVTGCATGEEAYSVAISFIEQMEESQQYRPLKIFATDLDREAINFASDGIYSDHIAGDVNADRLSKYFNTQNNSFQVKKELREKIVFAVHDALRDPPFIHMDLIVCRNFLIYLNPPIQQKLIKNFQFSLKLNGFLFLGPSENLGSLKKYFETIEHKWKIFKNISPQKLGPIPGRRRLSDRMEFQPLHEMMDEVEKGSHARNFEVIFSKILSDRHAPRSLFVNEQFEILYLHGDFDSLLYTPRVARLNLLEMIGKNDSLLFRNGIRKVKETKKPSLYKNIGYKKGEQLYRLDIRFEGYVLRELGEASVYLIEFMIIGQMDNKMQGIEVIHLDNYRNERLQTLENELRQTRQEKQTLKEQLETANEELQASNEELLAANEELQSTNEELQSVNEELYTVNTELQSKIDELLLVNTDISNLLKSTEIGTIFLDIGLRIRKFTPALQEQFNLLESDIGRPITNFTNAFNDQKIYEDIKKVIKNLNSIEREVIDKNGNYHLMRVLPYQTESRSIDGVVLTFININELKKAHFELEELVETYQAMEQHTHEQVMITDTKGIIQHINHLLPGYLEEELFGASIFSFIIKKDRPEVIKVFQEVITTGISGQVNYAIDLNSGKKLWFTMRIVAIQAEDIVRGAILLAKDVTLLKEQKLKIEELKQQLATKSAEETSLSRNNHQKAVTKLTFIEDFVEGAIEDMTQSLQTLPSLSKEQAEKLTRLSQTLKLLQEMIDYQKDASRLIREIDLRDIFNVVKKEFAKEIKKSKAQIHTKFGRKRNLFYIPVYIRVIFRELLDNSLRYQHAHRQLELQIELEKTTNFHILTFQDNGTGMDIKRYGHFLFAPFKRLTIEGNGSGTGLSLVHFLVQKNGGKIEVESQKGQGTTFTIYLKTYTLESKEI